MSIATVVASPLTSLSLRSLSTTSPSSFHLTNPFKSTSFSFQSNTPKFTTISLTRNPNFQFSVTAMSVTTQQTQSHTASFLDRKESGVLHFVKYHGLGNDFIMVNNLDSIEPKVTPDLAVKLCDRNFGIGADGVIFAMPGSNGTDYTMRIFNSDGSEPEVLGAHQATKLDTSGTAKAVISCFQKLGVSFNLHQICFKKRYPRSFTSSFIAGFKKEEKLKSFQEMNEKQLEEEPFKEFGNENNELRTYLEDTVKEMKPVNEEQKKVIGEIQHNPSTTPTKTLLEICKSKFVETGLNAFWSTFFVTVGLSVKTSANKVNPALFVLVFVAGIAVGMMTPDFYESVKGVWAFKKNENGVDEKDVNINDN